MDGPGGPLGRRAAAAAAAAILALSAACAGIPAPGGPPAGDVSAPSGGTAGGTAGDAAAGVGADAVVMKLHTFRDPGSGDMPSHTVLAPSGWQATGSAWWAPPTLFNILPSQDIAVAAPDGRQVRIGPSLAASSFTPAPHLGMPAPAEGSVQGGYPVRALPADPSGWRPLVEEAIRTNEPGAENVRVDAIAPIPELTAAFEPLVKQIRALQEETDRFSRSTGLGTRQFVDAVVLAAPATFDRDGRSWEILYVFGVFWSGMDSQVGRQIYWSLEPNLSLRAPAGALDAELPLLMSIAWSLRPTPEWARMRADHIARMQGIASRGHQDRMAILSEANRQISKTLTEGFEQRMASMDQTQRKVVNTIREVDDFVQPDDPGARVQLPSHYDRVFTNGRDEYILTDSATYDPNIDAAVNDTRWQAMERVP